MQDNQSRSIKAATLRGLHFQRPPAAQSKLVCVTRGRVLDVAVDIRRGSPTYGKYLSIELDADAGSQLYVPIGFAHGFLTLVDDVIVTYKVTEHYAPIHEGGVRWDDPQIGITWPFEHSDILSSVKDQRLPLLKDFDSPFEYDGHPLEQLELSSDLG